MTRRAAFAYLVFLTFAVTGFAQSPGVQRAMAAAREQLSSNHPAEAVAVLEAELLNANGNSQFLAILREAYTADLRDLQSRQADAGTIDSVRRRLKTLDAKSSPTPDLGPAQVADVAARVRPPAPPIPDAPGEPLPPTGPAPSDAAGPDPFQQPVRPESGPPAIPRASQAFAARQYPRAAELFTEADRRKEQFTAAQRDEWAYARLHGVAMRLNKSTDADPDLVREVSEAMKSGSEHVAPFGNQLLGEIRKRNPAAPSDAGWQVVEAASFRILHHGQAATAAEIGQTAEAVRRAMYERWAGAPAFDWLPKCDIYLHATAAAYATATGKPATQPGHSTVGTKAGKVMTRRIDLRLDESTFMDRVLPSEVTQVVLADLFADQPLPRWAVVGMAGLSESPEGVARYLRAVPGLYQDRKLFQVAGFLEQPSFPDPASVTAFYAESVSLVSYLVELKGPKAFATFLREAPRRGYSRALASHYGFKDATDLQTHWVKHAVGSE
jgi:hypothetical protein